MPKHNYGGVE